MDIDLYKSLSTDSVILIDHIEADIISKRQLIHFVIGYTLDSLLFLRN